MLPRATALLLAPHLLACSVLETVEAGPAYAVDKPRESAAALEGSLGVGRTFENAGAGPAVTAHVKGGPHVAQVALGAAAYVVAGPRWVDDQYRCGILVQQGTGPPPVAFFGEAGVSVLQMESVSGQFAVSALSPSGKIGVYVRPPALDWGFTLSAGGEYDQRFAQIPSTGYGMLLLGVGSLRYGKQFWSPGGNCG